ncbi:MAG: hypothetical protein ACI38Q_09370 [Candidatus Bruticola sp.]
MRSFGILAAVFSLSAASLVCSVPAEAEPAPYKAGQTVQTIQSDLDGDNIPENISLKVFKTNGEGAFAKLIITNRQGKVLGKTPEITALDNPKVMGFFDWGISKIHMAGQLGCAEPKILISTPRSDVRPAVFSIWSWNNSQSALTYEGNKCLINYNSAKLFCWEKPLAMYGSGISWIDSLGTSTERPSEVVGSVIEYHDNMPPKVFRAEFTPTNRGLELTKKLDN